MDVGTRFLQELYDQTRDESSEDRLKRMTREKFEDNTHTLRKRSETGEKSRKEIKDKTHTHRKRSEIVDKIENEMRMVMVCNEECELDEKCKSEESITSDDMPNYMIDVKDIAGNTISTNTTLNYAQMRSLNLQIITEQEKTHYKTIFKLSNPIKIAVFTHGKKDYTKWILNVDQIISSIYFAKNGDIAYSSPLFISVYAPLIIEYLNSRDSKERKNTVLTELDRQNILQIIKDTELQMASVAPPSGDVLGLPIWGQRLNDQRPTSSNVVATKGEYERIGKTYLLFPNMCYTSKFYSVNGDDKPRSIIVCEDKFGDLKQLLEYLITGNTTTPVGLSELLKYLKEIHTADIGIQYRDTLQPTQILIGADVYEVLNTQQLISYPSYPKILFRIPLYGIQCKDKGKTKTGYSIVILSEILFFGTDPNITAFLSTFFDSNTVYDPSIHDIILTDLESKYSPDNMKIIYYKNMNFLCCPLLIHFISKLRTTNIQDQNSLTSHLINLTYAPIGKKIISIEEEMLSKLYKSEFLYFCKLLQILSFIMADMSCEGAVRSNTEAEIRRAITVTLTNPNGNTNIVTGRGGSKSKYKKRKTQKKRKRKTNKKRKPRKFISKNYNYK